MYDGQNTTDQSWQVNNKDYVFFYLLFQNYCHLSFSHCDYQCFLLILMPQLSQLVPNDFFLHYSLTIVPVTTALTLFSRKRSGLLVSCQSTKYDIFCI